METFRDARENGAAFAACFIAHSYDKIVNSSFSPNIKDIPGAFMRYIDTHLFHCGDCEWIQHSRFNPRAFRLEEITIQVIQEGLGHLASRTVLSADKRPSLSPYATSCINELTGVWDNVVAIKFALEHNSSAGQLMCGYFAI